MIDEPIHITKDNEVDFQIHNLERNDSISLQVENFKLYIKRTDEGIVVNIYDVDNNNEDCLGSCFAFDSDTKSFDPEQKI